ncbi:hypothetical protein RHIZ_22165 [Rhizobium skierniewicense]|uniref:hypothetical protein n=1 Tax=Rhizobium skierniewicense TaxID=984260 RepID=UPI001FAC2235|nr:hypothetical protein [Rhizobium skierniewicense]MCI9868668.1 hypothetical protein [Rhizobium skierniewicense]
MSSVDANAVKPFEVLQNILNKAAQLVINAATDTTHIDDANPFQTKAFCDLLKPKADTKFNPKLRAIMSTYFGDLKPEDETTVAALIAYFDGDNEEYLNEQARIQYRALDALHRKLQTIVDKIPQGSPQHANVQQFIASHIDAVEADLASIEEGPSFALKAGSTSLGVIIIAWLQFIAVNKRDTSFQPLRIPSNNRTISVFLGMIYSRTANWKTLADMFVQRVIVPAPTQVLYTVAIFEEAFYGTSTYKGINLGSSIALVLGVMGLQEFQEHGEKQKREKIAGLLREAGNDPEAGNLHRIAQELDIEISDLKKLVEMLTLLKAEFKVDHATGSLFARLMGEFSQLIAGLTTVAGDVSSADDKDDPDRMEKIGVTTLGGIIAVIVTSSTGDNDAALGINVTWAIYFLYRLIKSTCNRKHDTAQTMHILSQAGINVIFNIFFHSIPLFAGGSGVFDNQRLQTAMTVILSVLAGTIAHKTGPFLVPYIMPVIRSVFAMIHMLKAKLPSVRSHPRDKADTKSSKVQKTDAFILLMTAHRHQDEVTEAGDRDFQEPEWDSLYDAFLQGLDLLEEVDRSHLSSGNLGAIPQCAKADAFLALSGMDRSKLTSYDPNVRANMADMFSAMDISEDVSKLGTPASLDRYKAFDLWISRLVASDGFRGFLRQTAMVGSSM